MIQIRIIVVYICMYKAYQFVVSFAFLSLSSLARLMESFQLLSSRRRDVLRRNFLARTSHCESFNDACTCTSRLETDDSIPKIEVFSERSRPGHAENEWAFAISGSTSVYRTRNMILNYISAAQDFLFNY